MTEAGVEAFRTTPIVGLPMGGGFKAGGVTLTRNDLDAGRYLHESNLQPGQC